jgi:protein-S-isoprenylcysteine O-methyltransferase Ste14
MSVMSVGVSRAVVLAACAALLVLPALAHRGQAPGAVRHGRKGTCERALLALVAAAFIAALVWVATPVLDFAEFSPHAASSAAGVVAYAAGLSLLYRSHRDLAQQWSITLEVREQHVLVTHGVYRRVRHPMYLALLLYGIGQALVLPNLVAGPAYLLMTIALVSLRVRPEEAMMAETFGPTYREYAARTARLVPGVW